MSYLGENSIVGYFSPVNESVWEHLKLSFFPMLIFGSIEYFNIGKTIENFIVSKTIGILTSIIFTLISFYTYSGIIGTHIFVVDIIIFILSIIIGEFVAYYLIKSKAFSYIKLKKVSIIILLILLVMFVYFTNNEPNLDIFIS